MMKHLSHEGLRVYIGSEIRLRGGGGGGGAGRGGAWTMKGFDFNFDASVAFSHICMYLG